MSNHTTGMSLLQGQAGAIARPRALICSPVPNAVLSGPSLSLRRGFVLPGPLPPPPPARAWPLRAKPQQANKSPEYLTEPLLNEVTEHLTGVEPVPPPIWGTWCGTIQGLWVGTTGAYNPTTGKAEAIALAEDGRTKLLEMSQCCVEDRVVDEHSDRIVRHTTRASNKAQLEREMAEGGAMQFDAVATHDWDTEELLFGQDGLFIFDGGSYCSGPVHLFHPLTSGTNGAAAGDTRSGGDSVSNVEEGMAAVEETVLDALESASDEEYLHLEDDLVGGLAGDDDGDEDDELYLADDGRDQLEELSLGDTSVIEACLQWNGEQRVRVQIMLSCRPLFSSGASPSELDVSLLRVSVCREGWEGMPGKYVSLEQPEGERRAQQASADERMQPKDLAGFWNEFEVAATTVEDVDMRTGRAALLPFYSSREYQRLKTAYPSEAASRGVQSSNGNGKGGSSALASQVEGGALWLPHRVAVQLTTTSDKGLDIAVLWSPEPKLMLTVTRRYSVQGTLLEVLSTTGIKAG